MDGKLRILQIIVQGKLRSGGGIQLYLLARELVKMGHHVCALYNENNRDKQDFAIFENSGIDLQFLPMKRAKPNKDTFKTVTRLRRFIRDGKFDIIHAHKGNAVDLVWLATIGLEVNIVTNRGVISPLNYFQALKYRTKKIKRIISVSQAVKDVMVRTGKINPDKISVVFGSVDTNEFRPGIQSTLRSEFGIPENSQVIGYVGSALPRKGLVYLIEAFKILRNRFNDILLLLVGVTKDDLKKFPINGGLKNMIVPTGFRKDVANCMAGFTVFAFSGIADEGLTGTVREAAAMGLPIVTTDVAGNSELIRNDYNGLVVPKINPAALAGALELLLKNGEKAEMYGKNARESIINSMSNEVRANTIQKIYYDIAG